MKKNYKILWLKEWASKEEVKKEYVKLSNKYNNGKKKDEFVFNIIDDAYEELMSSFYWNNKNIEKIKGKKWKKKINKIKYFKEWLNRTDYFFAPIFLIPILILFISIIMTLIYSIGLENKIPKFPSIFIYGIIFLIPTFIARALRLKFVNINWQNAFFWLVPLYGFYMYFYLLFFSEEELKERNFLKYKWYFLAIFSVIIIYFFV